MKEILQFQMMQMLNPMNAGTTSASGGGSQSLYLIVLQIMSYFALMLFEQVASALPVLAKEFQKKYVQSRIQTTMNSLKKEQLGDISIRLDSKQDQSKVMIIRKWEDTSGKGSSSSSASNIQQSNDIADALLAHIATMENVPSLHLIQSSQFIINFKEKPVEIFQDIYVKIDDFQMSQETLVMSHLILHVSSNVHSTKYIRDKLDILRDRWVADQQNKLGDKIWYFEQKVKPSRMSLGSRDGKLDEQLRQVRVLDALPNIQYEMRPFHSNKTFDNLFGSEARMVRDRLNFFLENEKWYVNKGMPHQLGLLLSGLPGSGKTAILRALANRTKRHIINLKLSNIATGTQLKNIFFNDHVHVVEDDLGREIKKLVIPADKRIYVFEEIDTIGSLVQDRSRSGKARTVLQDELTLGDILQILDGTIEIPGRILVMTSNYPERLDKALVRPGRIDLKIHFDTASRETIAEIINGLLDVEIDATLLPDKQLSIAEVLNVVLTFIHSPDSVRKDVTTCLHARAEQMRREIEPTALVEVHTDPENNIHNSTSPKKVDLLKPQVAHEVPKDVEIVTSQISGVMNTDNEQPTTQQASTIRPEDKFGRPVINLCLDETPISDAKRLNCRDFFESTTAHTETWRRSVPLNSQPLHLQSSNEPTVEHGLRGTREGYCYSEKGPDWYSQLESGQITTQ